MNISDIRLSISSVFVIVAATTVHSAPITFDVASDVTDNFRLLEKDGSPGGTFGHQTVSGNGILRGTGHSSGGRITVIYDTTPSNTAPVPSFAPGLTVEFDVRMPTASRSIGVYLLDANNPSENTAYLALFNVDVSGATDRIRFSPDANPKSTDLSVAPNTNIGRLGSFSGTDVTGSAGYAASTTAFVHVKVEYTRNTLNEPTLQMTVGNLSASYTYTGLTGFENVSVAFRMSPLNATSGNNFMDIDNLTIVPEPAGILAGTLLIGGLLRRRYRRSGC